jgi:hypothetical protein
MRLFLLILLCSITALAETPVYRFLFVVDSSQSMGSRKASATKSIRAAVHSGFGGQTMPGDTIDIWTFADRLQVNRFPAQRWNPKEAGLSAEIAVQFLEAEKFVGRTRFSNVAPEINSWIATQTNAMLFLVTDGDDAVLDLPIDLEINEYIAPRRAQARRAKRAFMIAMLVRDGRIAEWRGHDGLGPLDFPKLPVREVEKPPVAAEQVEAQEPTPEPPPPPVMELPPGAKIVAVESPPASPPPLKTEEMAAPTPVAAVPQEPEPAPVAGVQEELREAVITEPIVQSPVTDSTEVLKIEEPSPAAVPPAVTNESSTLAVVTPVTSRKPVYFALGGAIVLVLILLMLLRRKPAEGSLISKSLSRD